MLVHWRKVMLGEFGLRTLVASMALCCKGQRMPLLNIFSERENVVQDQLNYGQF
jgi:hypothetical protein